MTKFEVAISGASVLVAYLLGLAIGALLFF